MDVSLLTGEFLKVVGEILGELKSQSLAEIDLDQLSLRRNVLSEKLDQYKADLVRKVEEEKAKAEQDMISRGLSNSSIRSSTLSGIDRDASTELERAVREYNRAIEEISLLERKVREQIRAGRQSKLLILVVAIITLAGIAINAYVGSQVERSKTVTKEAATSAITSAQSAALSAEKAASIAATTAAGEVQPNQPIKPPTGTSIADWDVIIGIANLGTDAKLPIYKVKTAVKPHPDQNYWSFFVHSWVGNEESPQEHGAVYLLVRRDK